MHKEGGGIFTEFDTRNLRSSKSTGQIISSKILCEDNQKFTIKVKAVGTLPPLKTKWNFARDPYNMQAINNDQSDVPNVKAGLLGVDGIVRNRKWDDEGRERLLVKVFIDGNPYPERASVVILGGERVFDGRWGHDATGRLVTEDWIFTSVGIEHLLQGMKIKHEDYEIPTDAHGRDLLELQKKLNGDILATTNPKLTQGIEVQVSRVRTYAANNPSFHSKFAGDYPDRHDNLIGDDVTHAAGVIASSRRAVQHSRVHYEHLDENEKVFVTFRFQYMAKHKLYNLGLCQEDGRPIEPKQVDRIPGLNLLPPPNLKRTLGTYEEVTTPTSRTLAPPTLRKDARPYVPKLPPHFLKHSLRSGLSRSTSSDADIGKDDHDVEAAAGADEVPRKRLNIGSQGTPLTFTLPVRGKMPDQAPLTCNLSVRRKLPDLTKDAQVKREVRDADEKPERLTD